MATQLEKKRMQIRRRMAISATVSIILTLFSVLVMSFFGSDQVGKNLLSATGIISPILLCLTGLVVQYGHQAQQNDKKDKDNDT